MKILVFDFITSMGGVPVFLQNILPQLNKKYEVTFLDPYDSELNTRLKDKGVKVKKLSIFPNITALNWDKVFNKLKTLILLGPSYLIYIFMLKKELKEYELVISDLKKSIIILQLTKILVKKNFKVIYFAHGFNHSSDIGYIYRWAINKSDRVIAVSNDVKEKMIEASITKSKIEVIYNGVDLEYLEKQSSNSPLGFSEKRFNVFMASSLQYGKGVHILVQAMSNLKDLDIHVCIAGNIPTGGDAEYLRGIEKYIVNEGLQDKITFLGWREDIPNLIKSMDLVVLPSIVDESFGLIIAEAMACKKPVIASKVGGLKELVKHNVNGYLIEPNSVEELSEKIMVLFYNQNVRTSMGDAGYERIVNSFNLNNQVENITRVIEST